MCTGVKQADVIIMSHTTPWSKHPDVQHTYGGVSLVTGKHTW